MLDDFSTDALVARIRQYAAEQSHGVHVLQFSKFLGISTVLAKEYVMVSSSTIHRNKQRFLIDYLLSHVVFDRRLSGRRCCAATSRRRACCSSPTASWSSEASCVHSRLSVFSWIVIVALAKRGTVVLVYWPC